MFFENRSPGPFLEGPCAELLENVGCWCHVRFSCFSKRHPLYHRFAEVDGKKEVPLMIRAVLFETLFSRNHSNYNAV